MLKGIDSGLVTQVSMPSAGAGPLSLGQGSPSLTKDQYIRAQAQQLMPTCDVKFPKPDIYGSAGTGANSALGRYLVLHTPACWQANIPPTFQRVSSAPDCPWQLIRSEKAFARTKEITSCVRPISIL